MANLCINFRTFANHINTFLGQEIDTCFGNLQDKAGLQQMINTPVFTTSSSPSYSIKSIENIWLEGCDQVLKDGATALRDYMKHNNDNKMVLFVIYLNLLVSDRW